MNDSAAVGHPRDGALRVKEVLAALPGDTVAAVVAIVFDADPALTQDVIGHAIGKDAGTVRRALKRLADVDLIDRQARDDARALARSRTVEARVGARSEARTDARSSRPRDPCSEELFLETPAPPDGDAATKKESVELARRVFDAKDPKPVTKFVAVVTLARRFLDAGHDPAAVEAAMIAVPTITAGWVESALNRNTPVAGAAAVRPDAPRPTQPKPVERCDRCGRLSWDCTCEPIEVMS